MKRFFVPMLIALAIVAAPVYAVGAQFVGSIQGFNCVTQGKLCPVGQEDPVIAAENVFVLLVDAAKGEYYFVPNLDRGIMARHINQTARITGKANMSMKSIAAEKLEVMGADRSWRQAWAKEWEEDIYKQLFGTPRSGP
ncbi:MAG: hypothetical protein CVU61_15440 [Deltaproteobacteria bacterium HGW-Deltaproteobacteria-19]|nr:MAG: hypothetical protein CVU61_15440 [Deltaproteobacteria bacterium HGW-Deltaproteobacteria-19]